jgi:polysaccharide pyruvyl transferase WcaK-like protein
MAKIAIWGSYLWGNFGDDLMAIMTALYLKQRYHDPIIYKLDATLADFHQLKTTQNLDELLANTSALVIGGGGFLGGNSLMDNEWLQLENALASKKLPIHILSIGGDGIAADPHVSSSACRLMGSHFVRSASVRLESDIAALKRINPGLCKLEQFPDIVFTAPSFFPPNKLASKRRNNTIILNLLRSKPLAFVEASFGLAPAARTTNLLFAATHLDHLRKSTAQPKLDYEYQSQHPRKNLRYTGISTHVNALAEASAVISNKLHLGVTALAYGTPFFSINGAPKTQAFMRESGLNDYSLMLSGRFKTLNFYAGLLLGSFPGGACDAEAIAQQIKPLKNQSAFHWQMLDAFLESE